MRPNADCYLVKWLTFYANDDLALKRHFESGKTIEMLNDKVVMQYGQHLALYHCVSANACKCLKILMANGAKPDNNIWSLVFDLNRYRFAEEFVKCGFWPSKTMIWSNQHAFGTIDIIRVSLCAEAVVQICLFSKRAKQPMCHMWFLIAQKVFMSRHDDVWFNCLKD